MGNQPKNVLQAGQKLIVRWREAQGTVLENLTKMRMTPENGGNPYASAYVTFVDKQGVSLYIVRGYTHGGDMEAFLTANEVAWQAYFEPLDHLVMSYARREHYKTRFPLGFI